MTDAARPLLVRAACLYLPIVAAAILWLRLRPSRREAAGALLSGAWCLAFLPAADLAARGFGAWSYAAQGGTLHGFPVDLYLGWAVLWGPVAALALRSGRVTLALGAAAAAALDLAAMPASRPVVALGPFSSWWAGELLALALVFVPAQLAARWTADDRRLAGRVLLQIGAFAGLTLGLLPAVVDERSAIAPLSSAPGGPFARGAALALLLLLALPGLAAVAEFFERGRGTPLPYDPPVRLVTTGPYAYVANPMQVSNTLLLIGVGAALASRWLAAAGLVSAAYSAGFASWHEGLALEERFGADWRRYRGAVRAWIPRLRPHRPRRARIFVAAGCAPCSRVGAWLDRRRPVSLDILAAEDHPTRDLTRITYEDGEWTATGVAAFACALEHLNLGWALAGWTIRLPGVRWILQAAVDASGGGPRRIARTPALPTRALATPSLAREGDSIRPRFSDSGIE